MEVEVSPLHTTAYHSIHPTPSSVLYIRPKQTAMSKGKGRGKRNRGKDKATNKNENRDRDRDSDRKEDMYMNEDGNENVDEIQGQGQDQNQDPNENEMQNRNQNQNENHDQDKGKGKAPVVDTSPTLTSTNPSLLSSSIPSGRISELRSESSYGSGNSYMDSRTKTVRVEAAEKLKPKAKALKLSELMRETEGHADTMCEYSPSDDGEHGDGAGY